MSTTCSPRSAWVIKLLPRVRRAPIDWLWTHLARCGVTPSEGRSIRRTQSVRYQTLAAGTRTHRVTGFGAAAGAALLGAGAGVAGAVIVLVAADGAMGPGGAAAATPPPATATEARPSSSTFRGLGTWSR